MSGLRNVCLLHFLRGVGGTVASESALRSAGILLSRVRAPLPAPWPDGGPGSLRSPCCGLATKRKPYTFLVTPYSRLFFPFSVLIT
ncbi:hypothetical protein PoB_006832500 [Plakobranchus ocellatus]|uniref:Secreted protein n=1 Tax=Plakobranchus ocellatus TaxID=259542 RepID=A0AAV4DD00_9GAST|nr:hypothetical protein PoB_006832500 [Plakobranchus ocellatus]